MPVKQPLPINSPDSLLLDMTSTLMGIRDGTISHTEAGQKIAVYNAILRTLALQIISARERHEVPNIPFLCAGNT